MIILIDEFKVPSQEVNKCKKETIKYGMYVLLPSMRMRWELDGTNTIIQNNTIVSPS